MKYLKLYEFVSDNKQLRVFINKLGVAPLYHALKPERAITALEENKLGGYSIQRAWEGGKRYKDDQPEYNDSFWMRGISTSRDIEYCASWNEVIFVFDQDKLKSKYKVIPYNWGYSIGRGYQQGDRMKREREEFVITGFSDPKKEFEKEFDDESDYVNFKKMISEPKGYIEPLNKYLLGYFISKRFEEFMDKPDKAYLELHHKYLGIYTDEGEKKKK